MSQDENQRPTRAMLYAPDGSSQIFTGKEAIEQALENGYVDDPADCEGTTAADVGNEIDPAALDQAQAEIDRLGDANAALQVELDAANERAADSDKALAAVQEELADVKKELSTTKGQLTKAKAGK